MTDREEEAFRNALRGLAEDGDVDPVVARRSVAVTQLVMVLALVLVLSGAILLPRVLGSGGASSGAQAGPAAATEADAQPESAPAESVPKGARTASDPAPPGWRTEYYRDISFSVPAGWGYAVPPQSDWCADEPPGEPRPDQRSPYVWLGMDIPVRQIACPEPRPDSLLTEHVEAVAPGPATDYVEGEYQQAGWWIVTRFAGSAVLVVTTRDREVAEQILDSAEVVGEDAPCRPASPVAGPLGARPANPALLDDLGPVGWVALCQYEPVLDSADVELPSLRAAAVLEGSTADALIGDLRSGSENRSRCDPAPVDGRPDLAIVIRIAGQDVVHEVYVAATGCPDGDSGMAGGVDDGTTVRTLTRSSCQALLQPPLALFSASGDVGRACLG